MQFTPVLDMSAPGLNATISTANSAPTLQHHGPAVGQAPNDNFSSKLIDMQSNNEIPIAIYFTLAFLIPLVALIGFFCRGMRTQKKKEREEDMNFRNLEERSTSDVEDNVFVVTVEGTGEFDGETLVDGAEGTEMDVVDSERQAIESV